jgi:dUTPase
VETAVMERTIACPRCGAAGEGLIAMLVGCIADDYTGATGLASMLLKHGMRTAQHSTAHPRTPHRCIRR